MTVLWNIDNLMLIGGFSATAAGHPQLTDSQQGAALEFNGKEDSITVDSLHFANSGTFSIVIVCCPKPGGRNRQRLVQMVETEGSRGVSIDVETMDDGFYVICTASGQQQQMVLKDSSKIHDFEKWYSLSLVYDGIYLADYINGLGEVCSDFSLQPLNPGKTTIGSDSTNKMSFKGTISKILISRKVLEPEAFLLP